MDKPMPVAVALAQHEQAGRDLAISIEAALEQEPLVIQVALSRMLTLMRSTQRSGWTETGRANLDKAVDLCRAAMGVE